MDLVDLQVLASRRWVDGERGRMGYRGYLVRIGSRLSASLLIRARAGDGLGRNYNTPVDRPGPPWATEAVTRPTVKNIDTAYGERVSAVRGAAVWVGACARQRHRAPVKCDRC